MSSGAVKIPEFLQHYWLAGKIYFLHETAYYIFPPGLDITIRWYPEEEDKVYLIFALSFGTPRNYITDEVMYTDKAGFWHRGLGMRWHWDPLVESITGVVYPHVTPALKEEPFELRMYNYTDTPIYLDISVWFFEMDKKTFKEIISSLTGYFKFYRLINEVFTLEPEEVEAIKKKLLGLLQEKV